MDTDDVSLPRCEFRLVKVLLTFYFVFMPGTILWSFSCNVRRGSCVLQLLHCKLTLASGFAPAVCDAVPTEPSLAD